MQQFNSLILCTKDKAKGTSGNAEQVGARQITSKLVASWLQGYERSKRMKIGDRIKQLCRCKGITHKKLAEEAGITEASISLIVNNKREPRARSIVAISDALGVSTDYLLKGQEHE